MSTRVEDCLTPVLFARSGEEATRCCATLEEINILALVGDPAGTPTRVLGIPVLVPNSKHERASEVLASLQAADSLRKLEDGDSFDEDAEDEDDDFPDDPDDEELDDEDEDDEFLDDDDDE